MSATENPTARTAAPKPATRRITKKSRSIADRFSGPAAAEELRRILGLHWHTMILDEDALTWPRDLPFGDHSSRDIEAQWDEVLPAIFALNAWAKERDLQVMYENRTILRAPQRIPRHIRIPSLDVAANLAGPPWPTAIRQARERMPRLRAVLERRSTPVPDHAALLASLVKRTSTWNEVSFDLLVRVAYWFLDDPAAAHGLTRRQVPIPGVDGKWLEQNESILGDLTGIEDLGLLPGHPPRLHFTYLDPEHLTYGRRHDSLTLGDHVQLPYRPEVVIICENKDSVVNFPPVPAGVAVEGDGTGPGTIAAVDWIRDAPTLIYWGDMDTAGFEILSSFRAAGLQTTSILMDLTTYETYREFGTDRHPGGAPIVAKGPKPDRRLTVTEAELYERLADPDYDGYRRVEQERIPLAVARAAVARVLDGSESRYVALDPL